MARPTRTFQGQEGQRATGSAGPDPIRRDFDAIFAMFNPEATLPTGEAGGIDPSENMKSVQLDPEQEPESDTGKIPTLLSGIVNRIKAIAGGPDWKSTPPTTVTGLHNTVTNITVKPDEVPTSDTGNLHQMLSWIVNRLKTITGKDDWKSDPAATLQDISEAASHEDISFHAIAKSGVHGVGNAFVAKTTRADQWPAWEDLRGTPPVFPIPDHQHSARDIVTGVFPLERLPNLPASKVTTGQFDLDRLPNLPTSKVTSGVFSEARLPSASTSQKGIVQLTNSRSSTSESLALTAAAMNAHRTSADHDGRYPTRAEIPSLIGDHRHGVDDLHKATGSSTTSSVISSSWAFSIHSYSLMPLRGSYIQGYARPNGWNCEKSTSSTASASWDYLTNSGNPELWALVDNDGNIHAFWEAEDPVDWLEGECPVSIPSAQGLKAVRLSAPPVTVVEAIEERMTKAACERRQKLDLAKELKYRRLEEPESIRDVYSALKDERKRDWYILLWVRSSYRSLFSAKDSYPGELFAQMVRIDPKKRRWELR